jgi:hypothetical protein
MRTTHKIVIWHNGNRILSHIEQCILAMPMHNFRLTVRCLLDCTMYYVSYGDSNQRVLPDGSSIMLVENNASCRSLNMHKSSVQHQLRD